MNLVWHIFKKDLRRLWPHLLLCAIAAFVACTMSRQLRPAENDDFSFRPHPLLWFIPCFLLWISLFPAIVQADAPWGTTEFWMTRPISRRKLFYGKLVEAILLAVVSTAGAYGLFLLSQGFRFGQAALGMMHILPLLAIVGAVSFGVGTLTRSIWSFWSLLTTTWVGAVVIIWVWPAVAEDSDRVTHSIGEARHFLSMTLLLVGSVLVAVLQYFHRRRFFSVIATSALVCAGFAGIRLWNWPLPWLSRVEEKSEALHWKAVPVPGERKVLQGDRRVTVIQLRVDPPLGEAARFESVDGIIDWSVGKVVQWKSDFNNLTYVGRFAAVHALLGLDYRLTQGAEDREDAVQLILGSGAGGHIHAINYAGEMEGARVNFVKLGVAPLIKGAELVYDGCKLMIDEIPGAEKTNRLSVRYQTPNYRWRGVMPDSMPLLVLVNSSRKEARLLDSHVNEAVAERFIPGMRMYVASWTFDLDDGKRRGEAVADRPWLADAQIFAFIELKGPPVRLPVSLSLPITE